MLTPRYVTAANKTYVDCNCGRRLVAAKYKKHEHKSPGLPEEKNATVEVLISETKKKVVSLEEFNASSKYGHKAAHALREAWKSQTSDEEGQVMQREEVNQEDD